MHLNFRSKLLLAMMIVLGGITAATLIIGRQKIDSMYRHFFERQFQAQNRSLRELRDVRIGAVRDKCLSFSGNIRVIAAFTEVAFHEGDPADLYKNSTDEIDRADLFGAQIREVRFIRFLDARGRPIPPPVLEPQLDQRANQVLALHLAEVGAHFDTNSIQQTGFFPLPLNGTNTLLDVVLTRIIDPVENSLLGAIAVGLAIEQRPSKEADFDTGVLLGNELFSITIEPKIRPIVVQQMTTPPAGGSSEIESRGVPHLLFHEPLVTGTAFPKAEQISLYSRAEAIREQREFTWQALTFAVVALLIAFVICMVLAHQLSAPVSELVWGTQQIQAGNFAVKVPIRTRDELGRLANSFNEMAEGLALKEKYHSVLDMVADKEIARELMNGQIALGGEMREISVLFCDIRGFTPLTEGMPPDEVIAMLNEHFTPLTRVVYEHHGVVDKFVGDLIMAIFGAPKSYGHDAANAVNCALAMLDERAKLNATSKYQIKMGIGVATGSAVAGRMGSKDRLSYTVLGERVNLAARLCSQAPAMELVVDENTMRQAGPGVESTEMSPLKLKGFATLVPAFKITRAGNPAPALAESAV